MLACWASGLTRQVFFGKRSTGFYYGSCCAADAVDCTSVQRKKDRFGCCVAAGFAGQPVGRSPTLLQLAALRTLTCAVLTDLTLSRVPSKRSSRGTAEYAPAAAAAVRLAPARVAAGRAAADAAMATSGRRGCGGEAAPGSWSLGTIPADRPDTKAEKRAGFGGTTPGQPAAAAAECVLITPWLYAVIMAAAMCGALLCEEVERRPPSDHAEDDITCLGVPKTAPEAACCALD